MFEEQDRASHTATLYSLTTTSASDESQVIDQRATNEGGHCLQFNTVFLHLFLQAARFSHLLGSDIILA